MSLQEPGVNVTTRARKPLLWLWAGYTLLLVYGTWFPLANWDWALGGWQPFFAMEQPRRWPRSDFVLNLIVYLPFGLLAMLSLNGSAAWRLLLAAVSGAMLSTSLEFGQTFLPNRVSSSLDIALNTMGSLLGATAALLTTRLPLATRFAASLRVALRDPASGRIGLLALGFWVLSQWAPLVPSFDVDNLRAGLAPVYQTLSEQIPLHPARLYSYLLMLLATGSLAMGILTPEKHRARWLTLVVLVVLAGKILIVGRVLSTEALLAACCIVPSLWLLQRTPVALLRLICLLSLVAFHSSRSLTTAHLDPTLHTLNWIPFSGHMNSLGGVSNLLETIWVFLALGWVLFPWSRQWSSRLLLGAAVLAVTFGLEWWQQFIPGRYPDITDVLVATGAWWLATVWRWDS